MKRKFHSTNFLGTLPIDPPATWRVTNVVEPVTRDFFITSGFARLPNQPVKQRYYWKSKSPKGRKNTAKESLSGRFFESRHLSIDCRTRIRGKSFKQHLSWTCCFDEPWR